jgi:lipoprotein-anchoring transpeptidase ErfK/SrfK
MSDICGAKAGRRRTLSLVSLVAVTVGLVAAACGPTDTAAPPAKQSAQSAPVTLTVTPKAGAKNQTISSEIGLSLSGGTVTKVVLKKAGSSAALRGTMRPDGSSWVPSAPLSYGANYTATVTATSTDGARTTTRTTSFSTMREPANQTGTGLYMYTGETVGVGMPVVVEFNPPVLASARAGIQKRLFVTSAPAQPGVWYWASGSQVWYRPPAYWQEGTKISVRAALQGVPMGGGYYGDVDRSATVTVGKKVVMIVNNKTKSMSVYQDDKLTRKIPVSLGKPSTPSSSGNMVTMSHDYTTIFDTTAEGPGGYRVRVYYAMRLTWGGEFIHAAPWSVYEQGHTNVSHGCVNMSTENSAWLFNITHVGDPVTIKGTEVKLVNGNGWTAWNLSWADYVKGSALPVPAELANWTPASTKTSTQNPTTSAQIVPSASPSTKVGG